MSDPFDALRDAGRPVAPDIDAIKSRARRIDRRRRVAPALGAATLAVVAVVGVLVNTGGEQIDRTAAGPAATAGTTVSEQAGSALIESGDTPSEIRARTKAGAAEGTTTAGAPAQPDMASAKRTGIAAMTVQQLNVTVEVEDNPQPHAVDLTLEACNRTEQTIERRFSDAQRYDFTVKRGRERVWAWSDGRAFAQTTGTETWKPDECKRWSQTWNGTRSDGTIAPTGEYKVYGRLTAQNAEQVTAPKMFCLDVC